MFRHEKVFAVERNSFEIIQHKVFQFSYSKFVTPIIESVRTPAPITPCPTGRFFWGDACPRHFVPGYDRSVPPGHSQQPQASTFTLVAQHMLAYRSLMIASTRS